MGDLISRQALCEYALNQKDKSVTPNDIMRFPSAQASCKQVSWIPCSERLPKYWKELCDGEPTLASEPVLVCYRKTKCYYSRFAVGEYVGRWIVLDDNAPEEDPIAWMPLPEPWKGE